MTISLIFQSILPSVHDRVYITNISEGAPSLRQCYCVWLDSKHLTLLLKNESIRHRIEWDFTSDSITYNDFEQKPDFIQEITRILSFVAKDMTEGKARVFKQCAEGVA